MRTPRELSRRDFLRLLSLSLSGIALRPLPPLDEKGSLGLGRISSPQLIVRDIPGDSGQEAGVRTMDELVPLYSESRARSEAGRVTRWYRTRGGYIPAAYVQRVEHVLNTVRTSIGPRGILGEVTVPFTDTFAAPSASSPFVYRLYYAGVVRVLGAVQDRGAAWWYRVLDDRSEREYFVPARHVREILPEEVSPITPDVPAGRKHVQVDLRLQALVAYEYGEPVFRTDLSGGRSMWQADPTAPVRSLTPVGSFRVSFKRPSRTMLDADFPTANGFARPGIPWVSYFHAKGEAFHGVYWHDNFGQPMSHGCLNLRPGDALWIYRWTRPHAGYDQDQVAGEGTTMEITDGA